MSYEGYDEKLCKNGHFYTEDIYDNKNGCQFCDSKEVIWSNPVDCTNDEEFPYTTVRMRTKTKQISETCECCGHIGIVVHATFYVPTDTEMKNYYTEHGEN